MYQVTWQDAAAWKEQGGDRSLPAPGPDPDVVAAGLLCWEEHCVECSVPHCYATCSLFVARPDKKCARFVYGIQPNAQAEGLFGFGADIRFRRWAKLQTAWPSQLAMLGTGTLRTQSNLIDWTERIVSTIAKVFKRWSPNRRLNGAFTLARRVLLEKQSAFFENRRSQPHAFFIKCCSMESAPFRIQLELVTDVPVFRTSLNIEPGWNEHYLDAADLISLAAGKPGVLRLSIENDQEVRIVFTWLDFVSLRDGVNAIPVSQNSSPKSTGTSEQIPQSRAAPARKVKCVAWDLDNTLWHGVIGDVNEVAVKPNKEMVELIDVFDQRGILQTIVSKNDYETAWPRLEQLGLADYFLYPAIHWGPKSRSVQQIADELNINVDTFAVIDDSPFERREISNLLPQVRVYDPACGASIIDDDAFSVVINDETRGRRLKYLTDAKRKRVHQTWRGDYAEFLKSCHMVLQIRHPRSSDNSRCIELLQRSNQFNLSGRSYQPDDFNQLRDSEQHDCFCFEVADDFGGYGIVGVAAFETSGEIPTLVDFVLSCRVAQKMVEATFLKWYAVRQRALGHQQLQARLRVTSRNSPLRAVLQELGFMCLNEKDDQQLLDMQFDADLTIPDIITIDDQTAGIDHSQRVAA